MEVNTMCGHGILGRGDFGGVLGGGCGGGWDWGRGRGCGCDNDRRGCFITAVRAGCVSGDGDFGDSFW